MVPELNRDWHFSIVSEILWQSSEISVVAMHKEMCWIAIDSSSWIIVLYKSALNQWLDSHTAVSQCFSTLTHMDFNCQNWMNWSPDIFKSIRLRNPALSHYLIYLVSILACCSNSSSDLQTNLFMNIAYFGSVRKLWLKIMVQYGVII